MAHMQANLNYIRNDIVAVSSVNRGCFRILPRGADRKAKRQKFVVGDASGQLQVMQMEKSAELKSVYKTAVGKAINTLDLVEDKVFVACGETVKAYTKKGREFFKVETSLAEPISSLAVHTPWIWTAGDYVVACFEEGNEVAYLNTPDRVNALVMEPIFSDKVHDAVVACQDRMVRVIRGKEIMLNLPCEGGAMTLATCTNSGQGGKEAAFREIQYGTDNGVIGGCRVGNGSLSKSWVAENTQKLGGVTAIKAWDLTGDGMNELVVGRDDGHVEIFGFNMGGSGKPEPLFATTVSESVQAVDVGLVLHTNKEEIGVCTYTGKVLVFTADNSAEVVPVKVPGSTPAPAKQPPPGKSPQEIQEKLQRLRVEEMEIDRLKAKIEQKKEEYNKLSTDMVAVTAKPHVKTKFVLDSSAAWTLTIELDSPIDSVALQSTVDVELLDAESNACIVSTSNASDEDTTTKLLAVYRCTEPSSRIEMKVRTVEGQYGILQAFIIPTLSPKICQLCTYPICALSLHQRLNEAPKTEGDTVTMHLDGNFTVTDMHTWVGECLPEVPAMLQEDHACYHFQSTFQSTILKCQYRKGEAVFISDNITTLTILSDYISTAATKKKIRVGVNIDPSNLDSTCAHVLDLLDDKLQYQLSLSHDVKLIEALKEIEMQEQDTSFLDKKYQRVLENARTIEKEHKMQPRRLEFLYSVVRRLYLDKFKALGQNYSHKVPALLSKMQENYSLAELKAFFKSG